MSKYKTKQRDEILRLFMYNEGKCMSAREVCSVVTAGEATVFRTLSSLTEEGLLKRFNGDSGRGELWRQYRSTSKTSTALYSIAEKP